MFRTTKLLQVAENMKIISTAVCTVFTYTTTVNTDIINSFRKFGFQMIFYEKTASSCRKYMCALFLFRRIKIRLTLTLPAVSANMVNTAAQINF